MSGSPKALLLDFGGVITRTLFETHPETEQALGLAPGSLTWRGPFAPSTDPLWRAMQADEITERDYWQTRAHEVGEMLGENWTTMADLVVRARGQTPMQIIRPEALDAIAQTKAAGIKLVIFSNELDLFYGADFRHKLPFLADFDVIVDGTYTKHLKPDPRAYTDCLEQLGLTPGECLFVDDQTRNINSARDLGLQVVLFDVHNPAKSYVQALSLLNIKQRESHHA